MWLAYFVIAAVMLAYGFYAPPQRRDRRCGMTTIQTGRERGPPVVALFRFGTVQSGSGRDGGSGYNCRSSRSRANKRKGEGNEQTTEGPR